MRSIFQRFTPQNTTTGISHLLFLPCWPFVPDRCRHRHIIHPMDNTIVLWSETRTVHTSGSANHGIFTFTLDLVLSLWPLQSLTPKTDRKGDTIFQCNFFADQCVLPTSPSFSSLPWPCLLWFFHRSLPALLKLIAEAPTRIGIGLVTPLGATNPLESTEVTCHLLHFLCQDDLSNAATSWNTSQEAALHETNFSHPLQDRKTLSHC